MNLQFYLVTHYNVGGISFRQVGETAKHFLSYFRVFSASNTTFLESPFSKEEYAIYSTREHIGSVHYNMDMEIVSSILCINYSYGYSGDTRDVEGRIWEYEDGTFGFGFLKDDFIIDLKHIALDGCILDDVQPSH